MTLEFTEHGDGGVCDVLFAPDVVAFLKKVNSDKNKRRHVRSLGRILKKVREWGIAAVNNTVQLRHEGRFSLGQPNMGDVAIYAVKADQLRLYGGVISKDGRPALVLMDGTEKKKDKADRAQLEAVAKKLGEHYV